MPEEQYERNMVYAGEMAEPPQPQEVSKGDKKEKSTADWLLVVIAIVGVALTAYYIGFGNIKVPDLAFNATETPDNGTQDVPEIPQGENITYGSLSSLSFTSNDTTFFSRDNANLTFDVGCTSVCQGIFVTVLEDSSIIGSYQDAAEWNGTANVTVPIIVPKRVNATAVLSVLADSRAAEYAAYGATPEKASVVYLMVLDSMQKVIYGQEFFLDLGETANLTDLNATIMLESIVESTAKIEVTDKSGITFGSSLVPVNKPNATFFDFLTVDLLELHATQAKLIAWPNGMIEDATILSPTAAEIGVSNTFSIFLKCSGTCAAAYVGLHIQCETNLSRIGFYNSTEAWSGMKLINISSAIQENFVNRTADIKILADSRDQVSAYYVDLWNLPEKITSRTYSVK